MPFPLPAAARTALDAANARRRLRADLDSFRTPAERAELDAILSRHSAADLETLSAATGRRY